MFLLSGPKQAFFKKNPHLIPRHDVEREKKGKCATGCDVVRAPLRQHGQGEPEAEEVGPIVLDAVQALVKADALIVPLVLEAVQAIQ